MTEMSHYGESLAEDVRRVIAERDRFRKALRIIAEINNDPDRAAATQRCQEAEAIAKAALTGAAARKVRD